LTTSIFGIDRAKIGAWRFAYAPCHRFNARHRAKSARYRCHFIIAARRAILYWIACEIDFFIVSN